MLVFSIAGCGERRPSAGRPSAPVSKSAAPRFTVQFRVEADGDSPTPSVPDDPQPGDLTGLGRIAGIVKWIGPHPELERVLVPRDGHACAEPGRHDRPTEALVLDPETGGVADSVVYIAGAPRGARPLEALEYPGTLNQRRCAYEPRVSIVPLGARLTMTSEDDVGHNIRMSGAAELNIAISKGGRSVRRMEQPGVVRVGCDIHPWMTGYIHVVRHPYYAVTGGDGRFELRDVPVGEHEIRLWHEAWWLEEDRVAGPVVSTHRVEVRPARTTRVTFEMSGR